ncbi:hypothetical protein ACH0CP_12705 [Sphingomonas sp. 179-I 2A4 NHS]|uniref:hypothetical protein n=1 Tax=unclassified Sphingomonas TaxID=196159 RepID=UPI00387A0EE9
MPRVRVTTENSMPLARASDAKVIAADNRGGVAGGIAAGLGALSGQLQRTAQVLASVQEQQAETRAKEADIAFSASGEEILYAPGTGIRSLSGKAAVDAYEPALEALRSRRAEIARGLGTDALAAKMFDRVAEARIAAYRSAIDQHVAVEDNRWRNDVSDARTASSASAAIRAGDDVELSDAAIATGQQEIAERAVRTGMTESVPQQQAEYGSRTRLGIVQRLAEDSAARAESYLEKYRNTLQGTDLVNAERMVRISRDREQAEERSAAAAARAQQAHDRTVQREQLATVKVQLDSGAGTSADWQQLAAGYEALGDTSAAAEARQKGREIRAAETHRGANLPTLDARIGQLQAKTALSVDQASELRGLSALREQTAARLNQPGGALAQLQYATGQTVTPLRPADPKTYQARAAQAVAAAASYGRRVVEPLTQAEAQPLKDQVSGDSAERLAALQTIAKFGDPRAIDGAARQIAGKDDGAFRIAATLSVLPGDVGYQAARDILRGPEALKTNGGVFMPQQAKLLFSTYAAPALRGLPPDYASDVMDAAKNLYAARMTTAGRTQWDDQAWRDSVDTALGAYRKDGVKLGGIADFRGTPVSLPPGWSGDGLFRRLARATGKEMSAATIGRAPVWPDGSAVYSGQLRELAPVRLGGTRYGFITRNARLLGSQGGGVFTLDVAKVPWR